MVKPLRLGVVPYLNVAPIVHGLAADARFQLEPAAPARLAERLHKGEIDLGMIPSIEYVHGDYAIVPGVAIGSDGEVGSVGLFHPGPIESIRRVALDASSRTSATLLKILLQARLGRDVEYVTLAPDLPAMLRQADAALLIGDPALYEETAIARWDLGAAWRELTGLPFVYAFWAGRPGVLAKDDVVRLQASLRTGLLALADIAGTYNGHGPSHKARNEEYLRRRIAYGLGERERRGLVEFYSRAHAQGLIPRVAELRFY